MPIEIQEFEVLPEQPPARADGPANGPAEKITEVLRRWQAEQDIRCERMRVD
jgi:hypothetical protein